MGHISVTPTYQTMSCLLQQALRRAILLYIVNFYIDFIVKHTKTFKTLSSVVL